MFSQSGLAKVVVSLMTAHESMAVNLNGFNLGGLGDGLSGLAGGVTGAVDGGDFGGLLSSGLSAAGGMTDGAVGDSLNNVSDMAGGALNAGMTGDFGSMTTDLTGLGGTIATDAGASDVGAELTEWGSVAGNGLQAGLDTGDVTAGMTTALNGSATAADNTAQRQ